MDKIEKILFCPVLRDFYNKHIKGKDWDKSCKEINEIFSEDFYWNIEYNSNTSAGHPVKDDDIVRYSLETRRVSDKEH